MKLTHTPIKHLTPKEFCKTADYQRFSRYIGAIYILHSEANFLKEEADDILSKYGLDFGRIKQLTHRASQAFDLFYQEIKPLINEKEGINFVNDFYDFDKSFRRWTRLEEDEEAKEE